MPSSLYIRRGRERLAPENFMRSMTDERSSMNATNDDILPVARDAAREAATILLRYFGAAEVHEKQSQNLVTQADIESEERIKSIIEHHFPNHDIMREEGESTGDALSDDLWVVDPLDATNNYAHGIPHFCVSIAFARRGIPQVGVVLDPVRNELFHATRGGGSFLNDQSMRVSDRETIAQSIVATGFYYDRGDVMERTLCAIRNLFNQNLRGIRRTGGAALDLAWTASGRFDGFFEYKLAPWDYAAGALLVEEAGGKCCAANGSALRVGSGSIVSANESVFESLRAVVIDT